MKRYIKSSNEDNIKFLLRKDVFIDDWEIKEVSPDSVKIKITYGISGEGYFDYRYVVLPITTHIQSWDNQIIVDDIDMKGLDFSDKRTLKSIIRDELN